VPSTIESEAKGCSAPAASPDCNHACAAAHVPRTPPHHFCEKNKKKLATLDPEAINASARRSGAPRLRTGPKDETARRDLNPKPMTVITRAAISRGPAQAGTEVRGNLFKAVEPESP